MDTIGNVKSPTLNRDVTDLEDARLHQACQEFESIFIAYLLKSMRKTIPETDLIQSGLSRDVYISMMDEEVARSVARGRGIGLAEALYRQIKQKI